VDDRCVTTVLTRSAGHGSRGLGNASRWVRVVLWVEKCVDWKVFSYVVDECALSNGLVREGLSE
jgi:hypothetical protein